MTEAAGRSDEVFAAAAPEVAALARDVRALILRLPPGAVEVARPGDRAVSFGHGPAKMNAASAYLLPQARWLNLGFYHRADLPDPAGVLEGTGKALRHVKLHSAADLTPDVAALLVAAIADQAQRLAGPIALGAGGEPR
jgi:hypothetical protein